MSRRKPTRAETARFNRILPVKRRDILSLVNRMVDDYDDRRCYGPCGESRHLEIEGLLGVIDWGEMPVPVIRKVFAMLVAELPMVRLTTGSRNEPDGFVGEVRKVIAWNKDRRAESDAGDAKRQSAQSATVQ